MAELSQSAEPPQPQEPAEKPAEPAKSAEKPVEPVKKYYGKLYFRLIQGLGLLLLGCLFVAHTLSYETMGIWLPITMIILGLILCAGGSLGLVLGFIMILSGTSILLHESGLVATPYLREILGWLFIVLGGLLIVTSSLGIIKKYRSKEPDPDYYEDADKVDY